MTNGKNQNQETMDIFKLPEINSGIETGDENSDDISVEGPYIIQQMVAADPTWLAVIRDKSGMRLQPLVCFALVAMPTPEGVVSEIRPMSADIDGTVLDVEQFEGFVCLVPPGHDPKEVVTTVEAKKQRDVEVRG